MKVSKNTMGLLAACVLASGAGQAMAAAVWDTASLNVTAMSFSIRKNALTALVNKQIVPNGTEYSATTSWSGTAATTATQNSQNNITSAVGSGQQTLTITPTTVDLTGSMNLDINVPVTKNELTSMTANMALNLATTEQALVHFTFSCTIVGDPNPSSSQGNAPRNFITITFPMFISSTGFQGGRTANGLSGIGNPFLDGASIDDTLLFTPGNTDTIMLNLVNNWPDTVLGSYATSASWHLTAEIIQLPSPASGALMGMGGLVALRRRRK